jgi:hypothetical protein
MDMRLANIISVQEHACFANFSLSGAYWTSGVDLDGKGEFQWCSSSGKLRISNFWAPGMPKIPSSSMGKCVHGVYRAGKMQLENDICENKKSFVCEVNIKYYERGTSFLTN